MTVDASKNEPLMDRIKKPSIFIVSGVRTGTAFFTKLFNTSSKLTSAYHEPENIDYFKLDEIKNKSKHFGLVNLTIRKLLENMTSYI